jgi:hypothetical protein
MSATARSATLRQKVSVKHDHAPGAEGEQRAHAGYRRGTDGKRETERADDCDDQGWPVPVPSRLDAFTRRPVDDGRGRRGDGPFGRIDLRPVRGGAPASPKPQRPHHQT